MTTEVISIKVILNLIINANSLNKNIPMSCKLMGIKNAYILCMRLSLHCLLCIFLQPK